VCWVCILFLGVGEWLLFLLSVRSDKPYLLLLTSFIIHLLFVTYLILDYRLAYLVRDTSPPVPQRLWVLCSKFHTFDTYKDRGRSQSAISVATFIELRSVVLQVLFWLHVHQFPKERHSYCKVPGFGRFILPCRAALERKINIEIWWNNADREQANWWEKNLSHYSFIHHRFRMDWPGFDAGTLQWKKSNAHLNHIWKFNSYLTERTVCLHYKNQCWFRKWSLFVPRILRNIAKFGVL
jgi:hypothetical protein